MGGFKDASPPHQAQRSDLLTDVMRNVLGATAGLLIVLTALHLMRHHEKATCSHYAFSS
jgi:hypothetical protein